MNVAIPEVFHIKSTSEEKVSKIMQNIEISKAAGIDEFPGRFLKDGGEIFSKPISETCQQSRKTPTYFEERQKRQPI